MSKQNVESFDDCLNQELTSLKKNHHMNDKDLWIQNKNDKNVTKKEN